MTALQLFYLCIAVVRMVIALMVVGFVESPITNRAWATWHRRPLYFAGLVLFDGLLWPISLLMAAWMIGKNYLSIRRAERELAKTKAEMERLDAEYEAIKAEMMSIDIDAEFESTKPPIIYGWRCPICNHRAITSRDLAPDAELLCFGCTTTFKAGEAAARDERHT